VAQAVRSHLLQNPDIDAVFTVSDVDANAAISGVQQSGKGEQVKVCGINFNQAILENHSGRHAGLRHRSARDTCRASCPSLC